MKTGAIFILFIFFGTVNLWALDKPGHFAAVEKNAIAEEPQLLFIENKGQVKGHDGNPHPEILYTLKSPELTVFVHQQGLYYQFNSNTDNSNPALADSQQSKTPPSARNSENDHSQDPVSPPRYGRVSMRLLGAEDKPQATGLQKHPYYENYYNVPGREEGISQVASFERVLIKEVYPNIDWVLSIEQGRLKYDFIVHPGGRVEDIKMSYDGADNITAQEDGSLFVKAALGELHEGKPYTYQGSGTDKTVVECRYSMLDAQTVGFQVGEFLPDKPLVIDPTVIWATYYGGGGQEYGISTAIDAGGNVYVGGWTESPNAIADGGGHQSSFGGTNDAFLVKFDASGNRLWASYYGGSQMDRAHQVALDTDGNLYMTGGTKSEDGIAYNGLQNTYQGEGDAFLVKFNPSGERQWATYYGGSGFDSGHGVALDAGNNLYLTGITESETGIAAGGFQNNFGGQYDAFLVKFNPSGERQWATYYGGSRQDNTMDGHKGSVTVDKTGNIYIAGWTSSAESIAAGGYQNIFQGSGDAFLVKFNPEGNRLWASYYGGDGFDSGRAIAVDGNNDVYLSGVTRSTTGIASEGFQDTFGGHYDAFLVKFDETGARLWSTYYGGSDQDEAKEDALCVDSEDNVYLAGFSSSNSNIASCGFQDNFGGSSDAFVVCFNPEGRRRWASYFGGEGFEIAFDTKMDHEDNLYMAGWTTSAEGVADNGFQNEYGGGGDAFLLRLDPGTNMLDEPEISIAGNLPLCPDEDVTLSVPFNDALSYEWKRDEQPLPEEGHSITVAEAGKYTVAISNGCDVILSEPVEVQAFAAAEQPTITASGPLSFCTGESVRLSVAAEAGFSYQWLKDGIPVGENTDAFVATESGAYTVVCTNDCGSLSAEEVMVEEKGAPLAPEVYDGLECGKGSVLLRAEAEHADAYRWYENAGDGEPIAGEAAAEFMTPVLEASKTYFVSAVYGHCESERVAVTATIDPKPEAYAGEDAKLALGEQIQLQASGGVSYRWSPAEGLSNAHIPDPIAQPEASTTYTLTVTSENGCSAVDEITITIENEVHEVFIPNAFSPNNDGVNDVWEIFNLEIYPDCKISVFDRWGNAVFESVGYQNPWNGMYAGEVLPPGSYAYIIQLDADHTPITGTLMIIY